MGGTESKSKSKPLSGPEVAARYNSALANVAKRLPSGYYVGGKFGGEATKYAAPEYNAMSGGDYDALEDAIYRSQTAKLGTAWKQGVEDINQQAADRGMWASGVPVDNQQKFYAEQIMPSYEQAAAQAASTRYGMEQSDLQNQNTFNMENASRGYESNMRLMDYLQSLYNAQNGVTTVSTGGGWSI